MGRDFEPVSGAELGEAGAEIAVHELHHAMAVAADKMVVVAFAAEAVARLTWMVAQPVDGTGLVQGGEGAVDGREADPLTTLAEPFVDLLRCRVIRLGSEQFEHAQSLAGRAQPQTRQERAVVASCCLRRRGHVA